MTPWLIGGWALVCGIGSYWLTCCTRVGLKDLSKRFSWPRLARWIERKPVCCNVCMGFWASLPLVGLVWARAEDIDWASVALIQVGSAGVSVRTLRGAK